MQAIVTALAEQQNELSGLLDAFEDPDWQRPTRCEGWTVADVVLHVVQTNEIAIASAEGRFTEAIDALTGDLEPTGGWDQRTDAAVRTVDEGADLMVARERGTSGPAIRQRWHAGAERLRDVLSGIDPHKRVTWVAGEFSARTLATTRLAETWIHTGDVADAVGEPTAPSERLRYIARLAWRTLPYAFAREGRELTGPVAFKLRGPTGDAWDFVPEETPLTTIQGDAFELCLVAARRIQPADTALIGDGPDADAVLELVRTYA